TPHCQLRLQAQTFQTPALAAFDIEVDANSCFPELLLAVATVDVACRYCTLEVGAGNGVHARARGQPMGNSALILTRRSRLGLWGPYWASAAFANYSVYHPNVSARLAAWKLRHGDSPMAVWVGLTEQKPKIG